MNYKLYKNSNGEIKSVIRTDDNGEVWSIPFDEGNRDYQTYIKWINDGNQPLPADE